MKHIFSGVTRAPLLEKAFENLNELHKRTSAMFELAFHILYQHKIDYIPSIEKEDNCVNKFVKATRKKLYEYLAWSTTPNINSSLLAASILIDYERIGDLSVNIAQLARNFDKGLATINDPGKFISDITWMRDALLVLIDHLAVAIETDDPVKAKQVILEHDSIKARHNQLFKRLHAVEPGLITISHAINFALLGYYIRRINGHLGNIATSLTQPFPMFGFKDEDIEGCVDPEFIKIYERYSEPGSGNRESGSLK